MFATIKTNGATDIAIYIPADGADKSLPMLARMLEKNATFLKAGYQELAIVKPSMEIILGDEYRIESYGQEAVVSSVPVGDAVLTEGFVAASAQLLASNRKGIAAKEEDIKRLRAEVDYLKTKLTSTEQQLSAARGEVEA